MLSRRSIQALITILLLIVIIVLYNELLKSRAKNILDQDSDVPYDDQIKDTFVNIYAVKKWGTQGGGSGSGSTLGNTRNARNIIYKVMMDYKLNSILDAPCGSVYWVEVLLKNLTAKLPNFRYHGVDVVDVVIDKASIKHQQMYPKWKFSKVDISAQQLPDGYDLVFSRDALQHLPLNKVIDVLENIASLEKSKYFLVGSYLKNPLPNYNVSIGNTFLINLLKKPFSLTNYVTVFDEKIASKKYLILYDIKLHLKNADFKAMREQIRSMGNN